MARALAATIAALAALTAVVLAGGATGLDDWGIDHVMPALDPTAAPNGIVTTSGLWRPFPLDVVWWQKLLDVYTYPASVLVSAVVLAAAAAVLVRRGTIWPALVWSGAWLAVNAIELLGKHALARPDVHWSNGGGARIHVAAYDHSYPSGHTARAAVLAGLVAFAWPRLRGPVAGWLLLVPAALVAGADHTISDVAGGLLLGAALVLGAHAMMGRWTLSRTSSSSSSSGSWAIRSRSSPTSRASASSSRTAS
jgi:membrane-associated phospholipid phosphatase